MIVRSYHTRRLRAMHESSATPKRPPQWTPYPHGVGHTWGRPPRVFATSVVAVRQPGAGPEVIVRLVNLLGVHFGPNAGIDLAHDLFEEVRGIDVVVLAELRPRFVNRIALPSFDASDASVVVDLDGVRQLVIGQSEGKHRGWQVGSDGSACPGRVRSPRPSRP